MLNSAVEKYLSKKYNAKTIKQGENVSEDRWKCSNCGHKNPQNFFQNNIFCEKCGKPKFYKKPKDRKVVICNTSNPRIKKDLQRATHK